MQKNIDTYNMNNTVSSLSAVADATAFSSAEKEKLVALVQAGRRATTMRQCFEDQFELTQDNKTVKTPQTEHLDTVVDVLVAMQQQVQ